MSKEIHITFSKEHQDEVLELILHIQQEEFNVPITKENQPDLLQIQSVYQNGLGNLWISFFEGRVIGTVALLDIGFGNLA